MHLSMLSEIFPGTPNSLKISRVPSRDLGSPDLDRILNGPKDQSTISPENVNTQLLPQVDMENRFFGSTTLDLLRNWSSDNPMESFGDSKFQCFNNDFGENGFMDFNEDRNEFDLGIETPLLKKKLSIDSSNTQLDQEKMISQNFDQTHPLDLDLPSPGFNLEPLSHCIQDGEEEFTGKNSPQEQEDQLFSFEPKKNQKVQRKTIKKTHTPEAEETLKKITKAATFTKVKISKRESKNIVKNYGKAMAAFSTSEVAMPYLEIFLMKHGVKFEEFRRFIINNKEKIDGVGSLRTLLFADILSDTPQDYKLKSVFQAISEVFVRDFSLNWIFSCRSKYKSALLEFRFNMLRRVRDPSSFKYLKSQ